MQEVRIKVTADTSDAQRNVNRLNSEIKRANSTQSKSGSNNNMENRRELDEARTIQESAIRQHNESIKTMINLCRNLKQETNRLKQNMQDTSYQTAIQMYENKIKELEAQKRLIETNIANSVNQLRNNSTTSPSNSSSTPSNNVPTPNPGGNSNIGSILKDMSKKLLSLGTVIKGTQMAFNYVNKGATGATSSESAVQKMANRTGYYGDDFGKGRKELFNMSKDLGYSATDTAQQAQSYMSTAGVNNYETMLKDTRALQELSKSYGVDFNSLASMSGQMIKTGALQEGDQRKFAGFIAESIKKNGMTGREEEQIQVFKDLSDVLYSNRVSVSNEDMMKTIGFYDNLVQSNEYFKGAKGSDITSSFNEGITNGDRRMDILLGWGTKYQGIDDRWKFELQKSKGIADPENLSTVFNNIEKFTGNSVDSSYGKLILKDMFGLDTQVVEELMSNKQLIESIKKGSYGEEELKELERISKEGSDELGKTVKNYKDSTLASAEQYNQTKEETQESAGSVKNKLFQPFMEWRNKLSPEQNVAVDAVNGAAKLGVQAGGAYLGAKSVGGVLGKLFGTGAGAGAGAGATGAAEAAGAVGASAAEAAGTTAAGTTAGAVGGGLASSIMAGGAYTAAGAIIVDAYKEGHKKSETIRKNEERVQAKKDKSTEFADYAIKLAKEQNLSKEVTSIFESVKGEYNGFEQAVEKIKDIKDKDEQKKAGDIAIKALTETDDIKATFGKADESVKPIGSYAIGNDYVAEDGLNMVHKGEAILTKHEADEWRTNKTSESSMNTSNPISPRKLQYQRDNKAMLVKEEELISKRETLLSNTEKSLVKQEELSNKTTNSQLDNTEDDNNKSFIDKIKEFLGMPTGSNDKSNGGSSDGYSGNNSGNTSDYKYDWGDQHEKDYGSDEKMKMRRYSSLTAEDMNKLIDETVGSWEKSAGRKSLFRGNGQAFIDAYNETGINPVDLFSHAALETGYGTSNIAYDKGNFFGIGAFDATPYESAYKFGDNSSNKTHAGIVEGAKWIAKNYTDKGQDSYYSMRWNNGSHQYATDPEWDTKIDNIRDKSMAILKKNGADTSSSKPTKTTKEQVPEKKDTTEETVKPKTEPTKTEPSIVTKTYEALSESPYAATKSSMSGSNNNKKELVVTIKGSVGNISKQNQDKIAQASAKATFEVKDDGLMDSLSSGILRGIK